MSLSNELISQFVKTTKDDGSDKQKDSKLFGTIVEYGGDKYVRLDGSDLLTPISTTTDVSNDERVTVEIKNHAAIVTGNLTAPSAKKEDLDDAVDKISDFEIVIADKVDTDELNAEIARIDNLISDTITANEGRFEDLEADNLEISEKLTATDAAIENIEATKLDAEIADLTYATIENLDATNANIYNLSAAYGEFEDLTTEKFTAFDAAINDLETNKLSAVDADLKYANIDFSNIGEAAIEELFSKSGIIEDLVVSEGHITGQLVGVTISGDLIEGNTIKADKLVVLGSDGLYYKLNVNAETVAAEQTEYNSLNGSIITAKTITAEKINVDDLVAFNATIGGFKITDSAIYSGVKSSIDNSTSGVYLDKDGQISIGNSNQFVTFYKDTETNTYKLAISAGSGNNYIRAYEDENGDFKVQISASQIKLGSGDKDLEESLAETIKSTVEEFYLSDSPTELLNGSWSDTQPTWTEGKYIWRRTKVTYGNNTVDYTPSTSGVCITGNTGMPGTPGTPGQDGQPGRGILKTTSYYYVSDQSEGVEFPVEGSGWSTTPLLTDAVNRYLWNAEVIEYTDGTKETIGPMVIGTHGADGTPGAAGTSTYFHVAYSNSEDGLTDFSTTDPTNRKYIGTYVDEIQLDSTDPTDYVWMLVKGADGQNGVPGADGEDGTTYYLHIAYANSADGQVDFSTTEAEGRTYLGQCVDTNETDPSTSESYTWSLIKGNDGKGITNIIEYYAVSSDPNTEPTEWFETVPTMSETNRYLWNYEKTVYSDSSETTSNKRIIGVYGEVGSPGRGIESIVNYYLASEESSGVTTETEGWTTTIQNTDSVKKYLWNYERIEYTDDTFTTVGPRIIGTHGKGIQSTEIRYQVSDSQTELPTGEWTEAIPNTTTAKPYLWTRTVITYTDDSTSTSYSVSSTMDSIEVGATNLQRNSEFKNQLNYWAITSEKYISIDEALTYEDSNVIKFSRPVDDVDGANIYFQTNYATNSIPGKADDTFSISAYFYTEDATETNINGPVYLTLWTSDTDGGNDVNVIQKEINFESGKWIRETLTGTLTQDAQSVTFVIKMTEDGTFYMARPKLERGNQVTDWSPAPEDLDFSDAINETNNALEDLDNALTEEITETRAELEVLSNSISTLVVDENGNSMMTQTGDGWVFSMGNTITDLNTAKENIDILGQTVTNHDADINNIEASIGNLQEITSYIRINSDGDTPFIELGSTTSDFKLKITNSDIQFIDGSEMPAHITNQMLKINTAEIEDKLIFGGFAFAERANGNMGLFWKGSD